MAMVFLADYLAEIGSAMRGVPGDRRDADLTEIRQHLEAAIAGLRAQGMDEAEATEKALRQFGAAKVVGRRMRQAYLRAASLHLVNVAFVYLIFVAAMRFIDAVPGVYQQILRQELRFEYGPSFALFNAAWPFLWGWVFKDGLMLLCGIGVGALLPQISDREKHFGAGLYLLHHWTYWTTIAVWQQTTHPVHSITFLWPVYCAGVLLSVASLLWGVGLGQRKADAAALRRA